MRGEGVELPFNEMAGGGVEIQESDTNRKLLCITVQDMEVLHGLLAKYHLFFNLKY